MAKYKQLMLMVSGMVNQEDKMDFYRALSARGIYQTLNVVRKIKKSGWMPEFIFSATALYIRQTAEIIHKAFPSAELIFLDNLYAANEKNLLHFLTHLDDIFDHLLVLSESQPIRQLTAQLTGQAPDLVPSSCLGIRWPVRQSWKTIDAALGQVKQFWIP